MRREVYEIFMAELLADVSEVDLRSYCRNNKLSLQGAYDKEGVIKRIIQNRTYDAIKCGFVKDTVRLDVDKMIVSAISHVDNERPLEYVPKNIKVISNLMREYLDKLDKTAADVVADVEKAQNDEMLSRVFNKMSGE